MTRSEKDIDIWNNPTITDIFFSEKGEIDVRISGSTGLQSIREGNPLYDEMKELHLKILKLRETHGTEFSFEHNDTRHRCSIIDSIHGTCAAVRRPKFKTVPRIFNLGINKFVVKSFANIVKSPDDHGLILFAGKTSQGKTTTAYSVLQEFLIHFGDMAITLEDPPELFLHGDVGEYGKCFQVWVRDGDFSEALAKSMRYSPRYILIGEIRRPADAAEALRAAINGHVVLSTIHAGSVVEALSSITKMAAVIDGHEMARQTLAEGISAVVHQNLLKPNVSKAIMRTEQLFIGRKDAESLAVRNIIREGKYNQLSTTIDIQRRRVEENNTPAIGRSAD